MNKTSQDIGPQQDGSGDAERIDATRTIDACTRESMDRLSGPGCCNKGCADLYPEFKAAVEQMSGGLDTVILDDVGMPSVMVRIDRMMLSSLISGAPDVPHPAFLSGGATADFIYVSKYQNIVRNGRAYSLPMQDPHSGVVFDEACGYCNAKGPGWGLTPFALRAAIALWSWRNNSMPRGNNYGGCDFFQRDETGLPTADGRVATGSGPDSWSHNGRTDGIYDLNGNVNEWDAGLRLLDGEIQILPGSDSLLPGADLSATSVAWRAILPDGTLVAPGQPETLRYIGRDGSIALAVRRPDDAGTYNCLFTDIQADDGLIVPVLAKALMLFPAEPDADFGHGWRWVKTVGECLPLCGGGNKADDHAGIFFVGMTYPRDHRYGLAGFRSVYWPPAG